MLMFHNSLISLLFVFLVCVQQEQSVKVTFLLCRSAVALQFSPVELTQASQLPAPHSFLLLWECAVMHWESPAPYGSAHRKLKPCLHETFSFQTPSSESTGGRSNLASMYTKHKEFEIPPISQRIKANVSISKHQPASQIQTCSYGF